jgi:tetratricopeptide (TPR) repeat protein
MAPCKQFSAAFLLAAASLSSLSMHSHLRKNEQGASNAEQAQLAEDALSADARQSDVKRNAQSDANVGADNPGSKALDPNTQKELNKALEALRAGKPASAKKHLAWTSQVEATDPDVTFSWGMYYAEMNDWANAESYWRKTLRLNPQYPFALAGMGQLALRDGNLTDAIAYLEQATEESPLTWHLEERLAEAYYLHQESDEAEKHAKRAIEISEDRASLAQLVLAKVFLQRHDSQSALGILDTLLAHQTSGPRAEMAQRLVNSLRQSPGTTPQEMQDELETAKSAAFDPPSELIPPVRWMPPDVDEKIPPVEQGTSCPLQQIREESSERVSEFVKAVNSITATEMLEHEVIDARGSASKRVSRTYTYVVSLQETRPGFYKIEEYRNGKTGQDIFPDHLAMFGLTSLVMIFHPAYRDEYEFSCEGLSRWNGRKAWQVHFRQRPDKPARVRGYRVGNQMFSLALRGRAWIAVDTFQIVSLETDLVSPVPQIPLNAEHISIQYAPVQFHSSKKELWLPQSAELFVDFDVRRVHRSDHFSDYLLFSVDENQKISAPPPQSEPDPTPPAQPNTDPSRKQWLAYMR